MYLSYIHTSCEILSSVTKKKIVKASFVYENNIFNYDPFDVTHLDLYDFFKHLEGRIDHLMSDECVQK